MKTMTFDKTFTTQTTTQIFIYFGWTSSYIFLWEVTKIISLLDQEFRNSIMIIMKTKWFITICLCYVIVQMRTWPCEQIYNYWYFWPCSLIFITQSQHQVSSHIFYCSNCNIIEKILTIKICENNTVPALIS